MYLLTLTTMRIGHSEEAETKTNKKRKSSKLPSHKTF